MIKRTVLVSAMAALLVTLTACGDATPNTGIQCKSSTKSFKFSQNTVSFLTTKGGPQQRYYALVSQSKQPFWVNMVRKGQNASASAGWDSQLNPGNMSILALDKPTFGFACNAMVNNKLQTLDCNKVLTICELEQPVVVNSHMAQPGSYWVKENFK